MKKVLLILNTNYHSEVALALYGILKLNNYDPYIYTINNTRTLDKFNLTNLLIKYNINFIKKYDSSLKSKFEKAFLITPTFKDKEQKNKTILDIPNYTNEAIQDFKSKMILVIHKPSYIDDLKNIISSFNNCKLIGLSPLSTKFGLNYLFPMDNPIADKLNNEVYLQDKVKLFFGGRFFYSHRDWELLIYLNKIKLNIQKKYEITIIGEDARTLQNHFNKNENIIIKSDVSEIDFYNEINQSDFILNLLSEKDSLLHYHNDVISSNYNHSISFKKPQICFYINNLITPLPAITYHNNHIFALAEKLEEAINMTNKEYNKMRSNFDIQIKNMRNHNAEVLKDIL